MPSTAAFTANSLIWFGYTWVPPSDPSGRSYVTNVTSFAGTGTAKIPAGMADFITPGEATITHAAHE